MTRTTVDFAGDDEALYERLERIAERQDRTVSELLVEAARTVHGDGDTEDDASEDGEGDERDDAGPAVDTVDNDPVDRAEPRRESENEPVDERAPPATDDHAPVRGDTENENSEDR